MFYIVYARNQEGRTVKVKLVRQAEIGECVEILQEEGFSQFEFQRMQPTEALIESFLVDP